MRAKNGLNILLVMPFLGACLHAAQALSTAEPGHLARAREPRRLALLVGIGKYYQQFAAPWGTLHVQQEISDYAQVLVQDYGFARDDVRILLDEAASKDGIRNALRALIDQSAPGDTVVIHFSGHGQRLPDDAADPDEPDGLDESLVTYDAIDRSVATGEQANIRDDELARWLRQLADRMRPAPGRPVQGSITLTLDSCFSGSATRGAGPWTPRGRDWDVTTDGPLPAPRIPRVNRALESAGHLLSDDRERGGLEDVNIVAAARADQVAWEHNGQGAFTRQWVRFLARSRHAPPTTYHAAAQELAGRLYQEGAIQDPQVISGGDRQLFSATEQGSLTADVRVIRDEQNTLRLTVGDVHGVTLHSHYGLFPAGKALLPETRPLVQAEVVDVTPFSAKLQLLSNPQQPLPATLVALELEHAHGFAPLRLFLDQFEQAPAAVAALRDLRSVQLLHVGSAVDASRTDYDLRLRYEPALMRIDLFRPTEAKPHAGIAVNMSNIAETTSALTKALTGEWRWRHFALLQREDANARVQIQVVQEGAPQQPEFSPYVTLANGSEISLRLHNRSSQPLYVAVLGLSPDGDIDVMVGKDGAGKNRVYPGRVWGSGGRTWTLKGKPGDRVLLKVIATDQYVDFSSVHQVSTPPATRGASPYARPASAHPLQQLLQGLQDGHPPAATRGDSMLIPTDWGTTEGAILIR